jgi:PadR family transcriptional regulator PadR
MQVALALMQAPDDRHHGYPLTKVTGLRSGIVYPMLQRWLDQAWLTDGWEDPTKISGRPPRRYYTLTDLGRRELGALATAAEADERLRAFRRRFA